MDARDREKWKVMFRTPATDTATQLKKKIILYCNVLCIYKAPYYVDKYVPKHTQNYGTNI